ncbi:hypothetical protein C8R45DRAFT_944412 [Mycena sanguinolenta]|nr:hypothetical protein C8R45DRAFT_944412 [Mycena sanguinolenta]
MRMCDAITTRIAMVCRIFGPVSELQRCLSQRPSDVAAPRVSSRPAGFMAHLGLHRAAHSSSGALSATHRVPHIEYPARNIMCEVVKHRESESVEHGGHERTRWGRWCARDRYRSSQPASAATRRAEEASRGGSGARRQGWRAGNEGRAGARQMAACSDDGNEDGELVVPQSGMGETQRRAAMKLTQHDLSLDRSELFLDLSPVHVLSQA